MDIDQFSSVSGVLQGLAVVVGATIVIYGWVSRTIKKSALGDIGLAFNSTIQGLSSPDIEVRMASAVLLRRFFNKNSELGVGNAPFAKEAISSISAVLRECRTSKFQKVLADGLRFAPKGLLRSADFQGVNLTKASFAPNVLLGGSGSPRGALAKLTKAVGSVDFSGADFFQANLSGASFREVVAVKAVFVEATLIGTSFKGANLTDADFRRAMLERVAFEGAILTGAKFEGATLRNIKFPEGCLAKLDGAVFQEAIDSRGGGPKVKVFLSRPSILNRAQELLLDSVCKTLAANGCEFVQLLPAQYAQTNVLCSLTELVNECKGSVVLGFSSMHIKDGQFRPSTEQSHAVQDLRLATAWNHVEAGMALMKQIPVLVLSEVGVCDGVFDPTVNDPLIFRSSFDEYLVAGSRVMESWLHAVNCDKSLHHLTNT